LNIKYHNGKAPIKILSSFIAYLFSHTRKEDVPGTGTRRPAKAYKFHLLS